jgi:hypothetical protein
MLSNLFHTCLDAMFSAFLHYKWISDVIAVETLKVVWFRNSRLLDIFTWVLKLVLIYLCGSFVLYQRLSCHTSLSLIFMIYKIIPFRYPCSSITIDSEQIVQMPLEKRGYNLMLFHFLKYSNYIQVTGAFPWPLLKVEQFCYIKW